MDSFLSKFSLQHFLRQFFCGVIFFVPLFLFCGEKQCESAYSVSLQMANINQWGAEAIFLFSIIAFAVGTIIYHLEKNLYSYSVQIIFELINRQNECEKYACFIIIIFDIAYIFEGDLLTDICYFFVFCILIFFAAYLLKHIQLVIERTQQCWIIENYCQKVECHPRCLEENQMIKFRQAQCIAIKLATWSDFIHCVQSCCFSWIFGCLLCKFYTSIELCKFRIAIFSDLLVPLSIRIALAILLLEFLFDWHRYKHILAITEGTFSIPSTFPNQSK